MPSHWRAIALVALLLAGGTACSLGDGEGKDAAMGGMGADQKGVKKPDPVTVVEIDVAALGSVADVLAASATVESEAAADIIPMSTGIVVSLHRDEGDAVKKGDLLAVLDNVSLDAGAERASSDLKRLQEQYRQMEGLAAQGAVSDRELSDLRYQLDGARTSMREASRSKGQTRLTAPFDGVVAARNVRVGELAGGSTAAFRVVDLSQLRVVAYLPERDLPRVKLGQPALLISAYDAERTATGSVQRIAPVVDAGSGTFRVTVGVDPDQDVLRPGQFVTVDLEVDRRVDVTVVPRKAIVYEDGSPVVYVYAEPEPEEAKEGAAAKEGEGRTLPDWLAKLIGQEEEKPEAEAEPEGVQHVAKRVPVKLGLIDDKVAQVTDGLAPDDRVIVVGQSHLRDGARVRDVAEAPSVEEQAKEADAGSNKSDATDKG